MKPKCNIWLAFIITFIFVFISGCLSDEEMETISVPQDYMYAYSFDMPEGSEVEFSIKTDGAPVDLIIFDKANYQIYEKSFTSGKGSQFVTRGSYISVISKTFTYTSRKDDTYYIVIENADGISDGASSTRDVRVSVKTRV